MEAVVRVLPRENFSLELWFNTGDHRLFDARPYLNRGVFTRLQDIDLFNQAFVALDTVCWPGDLDIAPETLYDRSIRCEFDTVIEDLPVDLFPIAISMFYSIIIQMMFMDIKQHHLPHIHVEYQGRKAVISIPDGNLLEGDLPAKKLRLVQAWIAIHEEELMADWTLAVNGEPVFPIDPLR